MTVCWRCDGQNVGDAMNSGLAVRALLLLLAAAVGCFGVISGAAEMTGYDRPNFPEDASEANLSSNDEHGWIRMISPLRSDLEANQALILGSQAMQQQGRDKKDVEQKSQIARSHLEHALAMTPYDAELWLGLAVLEARQDPDGPAAIESLKMAYLTAPSEARLMPLRLRTATRFNALASPDLTDLARSDVRLMLTRKPDQTGSVVSVYAQASARGKEFLEDTIRTINPALLKTLGR